MIWLMKPWHDDAVEEPGYSEATRIAVIVMFDKISAIFKDKFPDAYQNGEDVCRRVV